MVASKKTELERCFKMQTFTFIISGINTSYLWQFQTKRKGDFMPKTVLSIRDVFWLQAGHFYYKRIICLSIDQFFDQILPMLFWYILYASDKKYMHHFSFLHGSIGKCSYTNSKSELLWILGTSDFIYCHFVSNAQKKQLYSTY